MSRNKRVNDNEQYVILDPEDECTGLQVTVPEGKDYVLIEIVSTINNKSFTLNPKAIDIITSFLNKSKRH
jgi:hypothetical protein